MNRGSVLNLTFCIVASGSVTVAIGGIPEPDAILFGSVTLNGRLIHANDNVTVVARVEGVAVPVGVYIMGSQPTAGDQYVLRIRLETPVPESPLGAGAARIGQTAGIFLKEGTGAEVRAASFLIRDRGIVEELNLRVPSGTALVSRDPQCDKTLWRSANNFVLLTFDGDIAVPPASAVQIRELSANGGFGKDVTNSFTFTVENDAGARPRVLRIKENGSVLTHRTWIGITQSGAWSGVDPFEVDYQVQVGDANNDGRVLAADVSLINAAIPCANNCNMRLDVNGDGRILAVDASVTNARIPSAQLPKPSGHTCSP